MGKKVTAKVFRWKASNGNVCFRFSERMPMEHPWIMVAVAVILIGVTGVEFIVNGSFFSLTPNVILFFATFLWWVTKPLKSNELVIEKTVHEIMDEAVREDAKSAGTEVVRSFVHYDIKGTYAIITGMCFLVLLKNGEVWEYPLIYHKPTDKIEGSYECGRNYIVSGNEEHICAIYPKRWSRFCAKFNLSDKTRLWLLLLVIFIVSGLVFGFSCWLFFKLKWWTLLVVGGCICVYSAAEWLGKKRRNGFTRAIGTFVSVSTIILYMLVGMVQPFLTIAGTYMFVALFAFGVPTLILTGLSYAGWLALKPETIAFLVITLGSILCAHSYTTTKWIIHQTPLRDWGNHSYESYREQLAVYLIHPSNVVFLMYLIYLLYLAVSGFLQIQYGQFFLSEGFDAAILKAFLVFIAFTNMKAKANDAEVDAKELLKQTMGLFIHDR